jgi:cysteine desulfurase
MIYLDHHATTPVDERVLAAMLPYFSEHFGNASSRQHAVGWKAERAVEGAREQVAALIHANDPKEIIFTSSATEANNLAIAGAVGSPAGHVVSVATEHASVRAQLAERGFPTTEVPVDAEGFVSPRAIEAALRPDTRLVCVMLANNEIGTIQRLDEIAAICRARDVWLLSDAVQAAGHVAIDVNALGVDLLSLSAHKIYGPKGVGALWIRRSKPQVLLDPQTFGGGQERGLRAGTLNVPGIVGFGAAAAIAAEMVGDPALLALRERLRAQLFAGIDGLVLNGPLDRRLPGNLNVSVPGVDGEGLLLAVTKEVAVSSGSACSSGIEGPSHVLLAIGRSIELAHASLRFGIGRTNNEAEIDAAAKVAIAAAKQVKRC